MRLIYDIIANKRDGNELSEEDIRDFLKGYLSGTVTEYQMSALLMAVFFCGMSAAELGTWTDTMLHSGEQLDFPEVDGPVVDKHSTGGVGDKISIPLAPLLGCLGFNVPMISGRGLGHTGGTLDKLESIPGYNVNLSFDEFRSTVKETGVSIIGQTGSIAPLDRRLYALRDVTGTVESIPLIASSIMSKKLAEGIDSLLLDVKVGKGAFMKTMDDARELARTMKKIGEQFTVAVYVIFSNMNEPLGYTVGNLLEIQESVAILRGEYVPQVSELVEAMAVRFLMEHHKKESEENARERVRTALSDGSALAVFKKMVARQGGDPAITQPDYQWDTAPEQKIVTADRDGFLSEVNALELGRALVFLGGGRLRKDDDIDHRVGFELHKKSGDGVSQGDALMTIHYADETKLKSAGQYLDRVFGISDTKPYVKEIIAGAM